MTRTDLYELLESTGDAALVADSTGRIIYWSRQAEQLLGRNRREALNKRCHDLLGGLDRSGQPYCTDTCRILSEAAPGKQVSDLDLNVATATGSRKWVNLSTIEIRLKTSHAPIIIHLMRDATAEKRLAQLTREISARFLQAEAIIRVHQGSAGPKLTNREIEVLQFAARGLTCSQTAEQLHLSAATVRHHVRNVLEKLDCHSKIEAIAIAGRRGIL